MFSGRPSVPLSVRPSVRPSICDSRGSFMFPQYLQYLLTDFRQTFVTGASRDRDELIRFWGQKVKVQGHTKAAEAHSTSSATFSSSILFVPNLCVLSGQARTFYVFLLCDSVPPVLSQTSHLSNVISSLFCSFLSFFFYLF